MTPRQRRQRLRNIYDRAKRATTWDGSYGEFLGQWLALCDNWKYSRLGYLIQQHKNAVNENYLRRLSMLAAMQGRAMPRHTFVWRGHNWYIVRKP